MHAPCPNCPGRMLKASGQCRRCIAAITAVRYSLIVGMWADGWLAREIAETCETSLGSIGATIRAMRDAGYDVPYRYDR
jgi:hypothetical protein